MTVVAAVVQNGVVYLGADTLLSDSEGLMPALDGKIWRSRDMLLGWTGTLRAAQVVRYAFTPPDAPAEVDPMRHLVGTFVPALRKAHQDAGTLDGAKTGVNLLLGWRGRLFVISDHFCVNEHEKFVAIGSGGPVAQAVLSVTWGQDPEARLAQALHAAQEYSAGVRAPFTYEHLGPT